MAKRFIDTGLFDDEWFSDLKPESKMFWIYYLTKCDHAGLLKYNKKLIEFQTGIKSLDTVLKELGNRLVKVNEQLFFCPKFIKFQYPEFPKSNVKQQASAIELLIKNGLWDSETNNFKELTNSQETVTKDLPKSHVNGNDNVNEVKEKKSEKNSLPFETPEFKKSWDEWIEYRRQIKKPYRSELSIQTALKRLSKFSEAEVMEMIDCSIGQGWQGLWPPGMRSKAPPGKLKPETKKPTFEEIES